MDVLGKFSTNADLQQSLKDAERGARNSGEDAEVTQVLDCAKKEIDSLSLRHVWQDAADPSSSSGERLLHAKGQRKMTQVLKLRYPVEDRVVGHALVKAAEGGHCNVVRTLRKGQTEQGLSVLASRFFAFALLKAVEAGEIDVVLELFRSTNSAGLALVGHELSQAKDDGYPYVKVNLTKKWSKSVANVKSLLPPATQTMHYGVLELWGARSEQESVHEATRTCFHIYCLWRLLVVAAGSGHNSVFRELLHRRDEHHALARERRKGCMDLGNDRVEDLVRTTTKIDDDFCELVLKITAKLGRDSMLFAIWQSTQGAIFFRDLKGAEADSQWQCEARSHFGLWELHMDVPTLVMDMEGSYKDEKEKDSRILRRYRYIRPVLPQLTKLNVQFKLSIEITPNYIELVVGINHVRVIVENSCWEEKQTGHFPSCVNLRLTPLTASETSVSMTGSSNNTSYKVGVGENLRVGVRANFKSGGGAAGLSVSAGRSSASKVEGKPWTMEQLPVSGGRGGSFIWTLSNLQGTPFDRLNPMLMEAKKSIWQFGRRIPVNPLLLLPFGSNGGVNFTGNDFDDTLAWRFSKDLENTILVFNIQGEVHTTYITQNHFWETRVIPFDTKLEQKLEPCGEPGGGDKKKKKKK